MKGFFFGYYSGKHDLDFLFPIDDRYHNLQPPHTHFLLSKIYICYDKFDEI